MEGRNERSDVGLRRLCKRLLPREAREGRYGEDAECKREELLRKLMIGDRSGNRGMPLVEPHASGGSLGDAGVMEVVRELVAVTPAADDQGEGEYRENAGLEEIEGSQPESGELHSRARWAGVLCVRDGEGFRQGSLGSSYRAAKVSQV